jgi:hypothetical protein
LAQLENFRLSIVSVLDKKGGGTYNAQVTKLLAQINGVPDQDPAKNRQSVVDRLLKLGARRGYAG